MYRNSLRRRILGTFTMSILCNWHGKSNLLVINYTDLRKTLICILLSICNDIFYFQKEAQSRKTPCKFYTNPLLLTPPDSHRKYNHAASSTSLVSSPASNSFSTTILTATTSPYSSPNCTSKTLLTNNEY